LTWRFALLLDAAEAAPTLSIRPSVTSTPMSAFGMSRGRTLLNALPIRLAG
jgi:hypothetical protein